MDLEEFIIAAGRWGIQDAAKAEAMFNRIDLDNSGFIDEEEMAQFALENPTFR